MRHLLFALTATLLILPACDDDTTKNGIHADLSVKPSPAPVDLAVGPLSCSEVLKCYSMCSDQTCVDDCYARDTAKAKMLDDDLFFGCPVRFCHGADGGMSCSSQEVSDIMMDPNANVSDACSMCMGNVDVFMGLCKTELAACQADKTH
jgi:hypothetical protein